MSDIIFKTFGTKKKEDRVCRVAYTLNQEQPVLCTYIDDQPLFYFDEEIYIEEEESLNLEELEILEQEIEILKDEIDAFERYSITSSATAEKKYLEFQENADSLHAPSDYDQEEKMVYLLNTLNKSRLARAYLETADEHNIEIVISRQVENAFYDRRSGTILINPDMEEVDQLLMLSKELRRHWQHRQGVLVNPLLFQPDNAILVNRVLEADLMVSAVRIAWELQLSGYRDLWNRIEDSPMHDLARSYAREANMDFRTINNGIASASIFETWFLSERCMSQDKKLVQAMLADYNGYVFEDIHTSKTVTAELIAGLGTMPFGKNYLAVHANVIMNDPIFTEVRDRSNANFLWFIKFERSFKETEHDLQNGSDLSTQGDRPVINFQSQDQFNASQSTAEVIQLFENVETDQDTKQTDGRQFNILSGEQTGRAIGYERTDANIIQLRYGSDE